MGTYLCSQQLACVNWTVLVWTGCCRAFIVRSRDVDEEALQTDVQRCEKERVWREDPETVLGPNKRAEFFPAI